MPPVIKEKECSCFSAGFVAKILFFFTASGLPHSFIIMHHNRYQQCIGAFILQAASESAKVEVWTHFRNSKHEVVSASENRTIILNILGLIYLLYVKDPTTNTLVWHLSCVFMFPERVDLKDRGRCDGAAEAGLGAAANPELLILAGVLTDMIF